MFMKSTNKVKYLKECVTCNKQYVTTMIHTETCCSSCRYKLFQLGFKGNTCKELLFVLHKRFLEKFLINNKDNLHKYTWFEDNNEMIHVYLWKEEYILLKNKLKLI